MSTIGRLTIENVNHQISGLLEQNRDLLDREYCALEDGQKFTPKVFIEFKPDRQSEGTVSVCKLKIPQKDIEIECTRVTNEDQKQGTIDEAIDLAERRRRAILFRDFSGIRRRLDSLFRRLRGDINEIKYRKFAL